MEICLENPDLAPALLTPETIGAVRAQVAALGLQPYSVSYHKDDIYDDAEFELTRQAIRWTPQFGADLFVFFGARRGGAYRSLYVDELCWSCSEAPYWAGNRSAHAEAQCPNTGARFAYRRMRPCTNTIPHPSTTARNLSTALRATGSAGENVPQAGGLRP